MTDYRILIVNDNLMSRTLLTQRLEALGFPRIQKASTDEIVSHLLAEAYGKGESFDLILLDWHMPGEGEFQFLAKCRRVLPRQPSFGDKQAAPQNRRRSDHGGGRKSG